MCMSSCSESSKIKKNSVTLVSHFYNHPQTNLLTFQFEPHFFDSSALRLQRACIRHTEVEKKDVYLMDGFFFEEEAEEMRELQGKFDRFINLADNYVKENKFDKALEEYTNALKIAPNAVYPKEQSEKIRAYFAKQNAIQEAFKDAVAAGDEFLKAKKYDKAKANYEKAAEIKPDDAYVMKKLEEVNKLLSYKKPSGIGKINEKDFNDE